MYLPEGSPHGESDSFDLLGSLRRVIDACRHHRLAVAATVLLTLSLVQGYLMLWPPIYEAQVMIFAESGKDQVRSNFYNVWNVFRTDELSTDAQLMTSQSVLERVVKELGLRYEDVYHPFLRHAVYLWAESWVGNQYRAVKRFFFPKKKSPYDATPEQIDLARTLKDFREGVKLEKAGEANVGHLVVRGPSPRVAEIANKLVDTYLDLRKQRFLEEAKNAHDALAGEVEKARLLVIEADLKRRKYYEANGMLLEFEMDKHEVAKTADLDAKIRDAQAEITGLERKQAELREQVRTEEPEIVSSRGFVLNPLREKMKGTRLDLQLQLAAVAQRYRPDSPEVQELEVRIKQLDEQIADQPESIEETSSRTLNASREQIRQREMDLTSELPRIEAGLAVRKRTLEGYTSHVGQIPEKATGAVALLREARRYEVNYTLLSERLAMAQVSMATVASAPASMRVADYAMPPGDPAWPNARLLLLGALIVGLLAGMAVAMLLDLLQGRVTRTRLLQTRFGLPVYGTLELAVQTPARALLPAVQVETSPQRAGSAAGDRSQDS